MSNEEQESEVKGIRVRASQEDAKKLNDLLTGLKGANEGLTNQVEDLENKLTLIAEKEFNKRRDALEREGYDVSSVNNPTDLKALEATSQKFRKESWNGEGTAPLNSAQLYGTPPTSNHQQEELGDREYHDIESMILDLNRESKSGNKLAEKVINQLGNKALRNKPLNIELDSPMRTIARKPVFDTRNNETPEQFEKRLSEWKKSQKWKNVGEGNE